MVQSKQFAERSKFKLRLFRCSANCFLEQSNILIYGTGVTFWLEKQLIYESEILKMNTSMIFEEKENAHFLKRFRLLVMSNDDITRGFSFIS